MKRNITVEIVDREHVAHVASMLGRSSAAARALAEYDARLAGGEPVVLFRGPGSILVGPDPRSRKEPA